MKMYETQRGKSVSTMRFISPRGIFLQLHSVNNIDYIRILSSSVEFQSNLLDRMNGKNPSLHTLHIVRKVEVNKAMRKRKKEDNEKCFSTDKKNTTPNL